jgi:tungstate transport system substrate-binding protein
MKRTMDPSTAIPGGGLTRRDLGLVLAGVAAAAVVPPVLAGTDAAATGETAGGGKDIVRLGTVVATRTAGFLDSLIARFQDQSPYQVVLTVGNAADLDAQAREGLLDILAIHFGVDELPALVQDRVGRWPQGVFATVTAYIAAPGDPAGILSASDAVDAFERIAQTRAPFVVNNLENPKVVAETLWQAAGQPDQTGWYIDNGLSGAAAVQAASQRGGYTLWGLHPFLTLQQQNPVNMRAVLFSDSLLQQPVVSVVVQPGKGRTVNLPGALALQQFLLTPQIQGVVRRFRHPQLALPIFWPIAHYNA